MAYLSIFKGSLERAQFKALMQVMKEANVGGMGAAMPALGRQFWILALCKTSGHLKGLNIMMKIICGSFTQVLSSRTEQCNKRS